MSPELPRRLSARLARQLLAGVLLALLIVVGTFMPMPFVALSPGPVYNTLGEVDGTPLITVSGAQTYPTDGRLDLTTVSESGGPGHRLSLVSALVGWLRPAVAVLPTDLLYPEDATPDEIRQRNTSDMLQSQDAATVAALREADVPVTSTVVVAEVEDGGASEGILQVGDVIEAVNGRRVSTSTQLRARMAKVEPGDTVRLTITRDDVKQEVEVTTKVSEDNPKRALLGIVPREGYESDVTVDIQLNNVGGPSAGLMFALGIYDMLTPGPLTGGRHIAGTGTMSDDGGVGAIGGIQQKMHAARHEGATVFFVPEANCKEALEAAPRGLRLVRADTLKDAIGALTDLDNQGDSAVLPTCPTS